MAKIFYDVEQAARKLGLSVREIESKVSSGELPTVPLGNRMVIPANVVDGLGKKGASTAKSVAPSRGGYPGTTQDLPENRGKEYYTDTEVAHRLNKPYTEIYRMANLGELPVKFVDDKRMFPKQAIDHLAAQQAPVGKTTIKPSQEVTGLAKTTASKEYFTTEQIASALGRSREDVERMIRRGEIKGTRIDGRRWVSREELDRIISKREPKRQARIKQRLPQPHKVLEQESVSQERQKIATNDSVEDRERGSLITPDEAPNHRETGSIAKDRKMFPKPVVDDLLANKDVHRDAGEEAATEWEQTMTQATQKLGNLVGRVKDMMFKDRLSLDQDEASRPPPEPSSSSQNSARATQSEGAQGIEVSDTSDETDRVRNEMRRASNLHEHPENDEHMTKPRFGETSGTPDEIEATGERSVEAPEGEVTVIQVSEREVMKTAQRLETSITKVRQMVAKGELVQDPQTGRLVEPELGPATTQDSQATPDNAMRILDGNTRVTEAAQRFDIPARKIRQMAAAGKLIPDPDTGRLVLPPHRTYVRSSDSNTETSVQDKPDAQKIRELEEWIKDLQEELGVERKEKEHLTEELEQEREEHRQDVQDAQYEIDRVDAELENLRRNANKGILGSRLKQERALREEAERCARELKAQLEKEAVLSSERERLFADVEAKLSRSEATNQELEQTLSSEREKVRHIEEQVRVLAEVRRLLGVEAIQTPEPGEKAATSEGTSKSEQYEPPNELLIQTRHGPWVFRPPFALEEDEIELIRLVAGEDEITAEQIKRRTGRRRAADDLDDLLDRLADEGLEPVKEANDRYSFDPDFMQN